MSRFESEVSRFTGTNDRDGTRARIRESGQCPVPIPVPFCPASVPINHPDAGKPKAIHRVKRGHYEVGAEIMAALMWGPKTWQQVEEQAGLTGNTSVKWMHSLHESGVIRISGYTQPAVQHKPARIWSLQTRPFALPDEVKGASQ